MQTPRLALSALGMMFVLSCLPLSAATITHTNAEDFLPGVSDGIAMPMIERSIAETGPRNGGVGVMPNPGATVIADDFNYASLAAAEAAGWAFLLPNQQPTNPSSFSVTDVPGALRLHVSRPQDLHNTADAIQQSPVLAVHNTPITGDFMVETKMHFPQPRQRERSQGIFIGSYGDAFTPVYIDFSTRYLIAGAERTSNLVTSVRYYTEPPGELLEWVSGFHNSDTYYIRVVKHGSYYYTYFKTAEHAPWIFHQHTKVTELAATDLMPVIVGVYGKSFGANNNPADEFQNVDFEYLRVTRLGNDLTGEFTNVFDPGLAADWRTVSLTTNSMQGTRFQVRAGNTLESGTLTDAGPFVGPDGTAATFFEEDVAAVVPTGSGKRYLEYKLFLDQTPANLPAFVLSISATYEPAGLAAKLATSAADFGAGGTGISVQPGNGDLSLTRSQVLLDDFSGATLGAGWSFDPGDILSGVVQPPYDPGSPPFYGRGSLTERPGYLRLKVGWPQDFYLGGIEGGGVKAFRDLPVGTTENVEIETEVNMEAQQNRAASLLLWQDKDNWVGIGLARRNPHYYEVGLLADIVLADSGGPAPTAFYGSNRIQLRVTKVGQTVTLSYRDAASPSPAWRVLWTIITEGAATGGADFQPVQAAFLGKSYAEADRAAIDTDFDYLKVSTVAPSGQKDLAFTLPAGSRPDAILVFGENTSPETTRVQVRNAGGQYVGPDGTSATYFTSFEPKVPDSLAGQTTADLRITMDGATTSGVPYLHAAGIQYASGDTRVARDTNASDFTAGTGLGIDRSGRGVISGMVELGNPTTEEFTSQPANWLFSDVNPGNPAPTASFQSGAARLTIPRVVDTWGGGGPLDKPRAFLYDDKVYTGDYEVEALLNVAEPRQANRHGGIAIVAARPAGTTKDDKIDVTNLLMFGPYNITDMRFLRAENNGFGDFGPGGWPGQTFYLRIRKVGNSFIGYARTDPSQPWVQVEQTTNANLSNAYIGFLAKSWPSDPNVQNYDFDYLKVTPILATSGTFESRVLDLGAAGLYPFMDSLGGNSAGARLQWRAANTPEALATAPYMGPDGTSATTFAANFMGFLPQSLAGKRYFQYKATLQVGQTLNDIAVVGLTTGPNLPLSNSDVVAALRIAGGLDAASGASMSRLDVADGSSAGRVDMADALAIARQVNGL